MENVLVILDEFVKKIGKGWVVIGGVGLLLLVSGTIILLRGSQPKAVEIVEEEVASSSAQTTMAIDIEGAVEHPGVYQIPMGSRVADALVAAGGLSSVADRERIAKTINQASKLSDGMKLYLPKTGEQTAGTSQISSDTVVLAASTKLININTASLDQLDTLPGIGPVTAQKIISSRPYGSIDELTRRSVVTQSVFGKIKEKISVD